MTHVLGKVRTESIRGASFSSVHVRILTFCAQSEGGKADTFRKLGVLLAKDRIHTSFDGLTQDRLVAAVSYAEAD